MRRVIRNALSQVGFEDVKEAENGNDALAMLRSGDSYGLVIAGANMEPMSGLQLLKRLHADVRLTRMPFILVTAESSMISDRLLQYLQLRSRGNAVLETPFNVETLLKRLQANGQCR